MYEWVLFLHVLSAFVLVGALTALAYAGSLRPCLATPCTRQKRETIT